METSKEHALDRLDIIRQDVLDEMSRLRCERAQACFDIKDRNELRVALVELGDQIADVEATLRDIDGAVGDVRRSEFMLTGQEEIAA